MLTNRTSLRHYFPFLMALSVLVFLSGCAPAQPETQSAPTGEEPISITVLDRPFLSFAPFYIAQEEGYFAEQGLKVEFVSIATDVEATTAVLQGQIDVAGEFLTANLINGMANQSDVRIVADKGSLNPDVCSANGLVVSTELLEGGFEIADMAGKRVAMAPTTVEGYLVQQLLDRADLTLDDLEIIQIPTPSELSALGDGSIDIVAASEPWMTRMSDEGYGRTWVEWESEFPGFQFAFILYGKKLTTDNPEAGNRFMTAYLKGVRQYNEGPTERNLEIISGFSGLEPEFLKRACWSYIRTDGEVNMDSILEYQQWAVDAGYVEDTITAEQGYDPSFLEAARQALGDE